jgi:hypothetical protein
VSGKTPADTLATLNDVREGIEAELEDRQQQVPPGSPPVDARDLVTASVVTLSTSANPQTGAKLRSATAALALGLGATLGGAFLAESIARSRKTSTSLLDRIALPNKPGSVEPGEAAAPEPAAENGEGADAPPRPVAVPAGRHRSGRIRP